MSKQGVTMAYLTMKGGVGKTTLAANITRALADISPRKILLIDADAQCNLSQIFLTEDALESRSTRSIYEAFDSSHKMYGPSDLKTTIYSNQNNHSTIDFIAGSFDTFGLVVATPRVQKRAQETFSQFIEKARSEYDLVVIDTNPSATFVTLRALEVSNFLVAPITFDDFSMRGLDLIVRTMRHQYDWLSNPRRIRIVPNKVRRARDERAAEAQDAEERRIVSKYQHLEESVTLSRIHESRFLDNRVSKRGLGFVVDQRVLPIHWNALKRVKSDFEAVGHAIKGALDEAFPPNKEPDPTSSGKTAKERIEDYFDRAVVRH